MGNKKNRPGRAVEAGFYKPFYERENRYSSPSRDRIFMLENMYVRVLSEMCLGRYEWKNLPEGIDSRFIELSLMRTGLVGIFYHEPVGRIISARISPSGRYDMQDNPVNYVVTGNHLQGLVLGAFQAHRPDDMNKRVIPIWSNFMRSPDWDIISLFAFRLAQLDRTIEINSNNARRSRVLVYDESQKLSAENLNKQLDEGEAVIPVNTQLDIERLIQSIDMNVDPRTIGELSVLRNQEWNRLMGLLGINNSNQDKKERLVEDEVSANNDQVSTARETNLKARQRAADNFNAAFPSYVEQYGPVTVEYHDVNGAAPAIGMGSESVEGT